MNVNFYDSGANVPEKDRYERGVDYLCHEFDLGFEDAFYLVEHLKNNRSNVFIGAPSATVNFYIFEDELNVQMEQHKGRFSYRCIWFARKSSVSPALGDSWLAAYVDKDKKTILIIHNNWLKK